VQLSLAGTDALCATPAFFLQPPAAAADAARPSAEPTTLRFTFTCALRGVRPDSVCLLRVRFCAASREALAVHGCVLLVAEDEGAAVVDARCYRECASPLLLASALTALGLAA